MLKNTYDAEDTVQDVLIKYMTKKPLFETYEHEKAWLIRVTINLCKDKLRFYKQHPYINIETIKTTYPEDSIDNQILAILLELPSKYKEVLLLYYVEGYKCFEISKILKSLVAKGYITVEKHGNNRYYIAGVEKFIEGNAPVQEEEASTVEGLSASQEKTLMKLAGTKERFLQMVNYARSRAKNLFAYVYRLLKDNVVLGAKDTSVNPHYNSATPKGYSDFNNFKAREYDYEALERQLLGWD